MATLKELSKRNELFSGGHRLCTGCGIPPIVRLLLRSANGPVVATTATGCLEVGTTIYPYTSWRIPWIHSAFENAAATISGIETAYKAFKKRGRIPKDKEIKFIAGFDNDFVIFVFFFMWYKLNFQYIFSQIFRF